MKAVPDRKYIDHSRGRLKFFAYIAARPNQIAGTRSNSQTLNVRSTSRHGPKNIGMSDAVGTAPLIAGRVFATGNVSQRTGGRMGAAIKG